MELKRWWFQSKKSLRHFIKTKDIEHLKDVWRLTKFYAKKITVTGMTANKNIQDNYTTRKEDLHELRRRHRLGKERTRNEPRAIGK